MIIRGLMQSKKPLLHLSHMAALFSIFAALAFAFVCAAAARLGPPGGRTPSPAPAPSPTSYLSALANQGTSILVWLRTIKGRLVSTEVLVAFTAVAFASTAVMGFVNVRTLNKPRATKMIGYAILSVSPVMASYAIGYVQSTPFGNDLFVVCAVYIVLVLGSIQSVSPVRVDINLLKGSLLREMSQIVSIFTIIFSETLSTGGFEVVLWLLTATAVCKLVHGFLIYNWARVTWTMDESGLNIAETTIAVNRFVDQDKQHRFLVTGEISGEQWVSLGRVWEWQGELFEGERGKKLKDLCLSFALFKLLKILLGGQDLSKHELGMTPGFVRGTLLGLGNKSTDYVHEDAKGVGADGHEEEEADDIKRADRAFWIAQQEIRLLYSQFHTRYPIIISNWFIKACTATAVLLLLAGQLTLYYTLSVYEVPRDNTNQIYQGVNVDVLVTLGIATIAWAVVTVDLIFPFLSNWNHIHAICYYVQQDHDRSNRSQRLVLASAVLHENSKIFQYSLVEDCGKRAILSRVTCGLLDKSRDGQNVTRSVDLPVPVKRAVAAYLRRHLKGNERLKLKKGKEEVDGYRKELAEALWTIAGSSENKEIVEAEKILSFMLSESNREGENETSRILEQIFIWHIATTQLACRSRARGGGGDDRIEKWYDFASFAPESYRQNAAVAISLSCYCAYLVACQRGLLPGGRQFTEKYFDFMVIAARGLFGGGRKSVRSKYEKLMKTPLEEVLRGEVMAVELAASMWFGRGLPLEPKTWEMLAGFWTAMVMFLAMSSKPAAHIETLPVGAELLTQIWVLISHSGGAID